TCNVVMCVVASLMLAGTCGISGPGILRVLHSFPTRRSSDLGGLVALPLIGGDDAARLEGQPVRLIFMTRDGPYEVLRRVEASTRSEEHTSELQSREKLVCRLLRAKKEEARARARSACPPQPQ